MNELLSSLPYNNGGLGTTNQENPKHTLSPGMNSHCTTGFLARFTGVRTNAMYALLQCEKPNWNKITTTYRVCAPSS